MAKTREIACVHYLCEGNCDLGKKCEFWGHCQTCKTWKRKPGAKPPRVDTRRQKAERIMRKERWDY